MDALYLDDKSVIQQLEALVLSEREALVTLLRLLRELEKRRLYLELGYSSVFAFCLERLGYTEHEAQLRIQATRLSAKLPEVEESISSGRLSLTVASRAESHFRRLEVQDRPVPLKIQREIVNGLLGLSVREAERKLAEQFPGEPPRERIQFLHDGKVKVELILELRVWQQFDELRDLRTHVNPARRLDIMFRDMLHIAWKKWHPLARAERSPRASAVAAQQKDALA